MDFCCVYASILINLNAFVFSDRMLPHFEHSSAM